MNRTMILNIRWAGAPVESFQEWHPWCCGKQRQPDYREKLTKHQFYTTALLLTNIFYFSEKIPKHLWPLTGINKVGFFVHIIFILLVSNKDNCFELSDHILWFIHTYPCGVITLWVVSAAQKLSRIAHDSRFLCQEPEANRIATAPAVPSWWNSTRWLVARVDFQTQASNFKVFPLAGGVQTTWWGLPGPVAMSKRDAHL